MEWQKNKSGGKCRIEYQPIRGAAAKRHWLSGVSDVLEDSLAAETP
jgi:hypothetical protein